MAAALRKQPARPAWREWWQVQLQQPQALRQHHPHPWPESRPEYLLWNRAWPPEPLASVLRRAPLALPPPVPVQRTQALEPPAQESLTTRLPRLFELGSLPEYLLWKASSRPSRLTSRAEWQRFDGVDTICPPLERTDSVNIPAG